MTSSEHPRICPFDSCFSDLAERNNLPLAFWVCDLDGKFLLVKGAVLQQCDLLGNTCWKVFADDMKMWALYTKVLHDRKTVRYDIIYEGRTWDCILEPTNDGCQGIAIETTLTSNLKDQWKTLIDTIPFAIALVNPDGVILQASQSLNEMLGYEDLVGVNYKDITHPDDVEKDFVKHKALVGGKIARYSINKRYVHKEGHNVYVFLEVGIVKSTNIAIAYIHDVTDKTKEEFSKAIDFEILEGVFENRFFLQYQPIIRLKDKKTVGFECLVRFDSNHGVVYPGAFLSRLSTPTQLLLTLEVAKLACLQLKALKLRSMEDLWLAINLSPYDIGSKGFLGRFNAVFESHGADRKKIRLEITEQDILNEPMIHVLETLQNQGHTIELDDFGSGYSSLGSIATYPISVIKIDKSMLDGIPGDKNKERVFRLILTMADTLGHEVIAEGVETEEQAQWLEFNGCEYAQGYFFGKPGEI